MKESSGDPHALRFEPAWKLYKDPVLFCAKNRTTVETEKSMQAHSFGLMQAMGCVMRERGFQGPWALAFDLDINLQAGCKHLKIFIDRCGGDEAQAIASYNAGSPRRNNEGKFVNQDYVDGVFKFMNSLKSKFPEPLV